MKILKNSLLVCLTIFFFSCSTDDSSPIDTNAQEDDLVGTWNLTEEGQIGKISTVFNNAPLNADITSTGKDLNTQITFTQNPNNFSSSGGYTDAIEVSAPLFGTIFERDVEVPISDYINQGTWSINQGILTFTQNNVEQPVNITELTSNSLKIELEIKDQEVTFDDFTGTVSTTIKMTLAKQ